MVSIDTFVSSRHLVKLAGLANQTASISDHPQAGRISAQDTVIVCARGIPPIDTNVSTNTFV
jgi:hypothetical protein